MRKFLVFPDGGEVELTPLTCEEFTQLDRWVGGNDTAYREFLRHNKFHEIGEFANLSECVWNGKGWELVVKLVLVSGDPVIDWSAEYGNLPPAQGV